MGGTLEGQIDALRKAIATQEELRAVLGDDSVDATLAILHEQLTQLEEESATGGEQDRTRQQRKQVTVLFADLPGFTAACEGMDPEDVSEMMNALWVRMDGIIAEHSGLIDKHIGDAVMALWGAQMSREDDPEQAIRAALAMQRAISDFGTDRFRELPVQMRIGIHTGPALLGEIGTTGEYTAIGDTVNTADRLEEAAPLEGVLISHDTYRHVRGVFTVLMLDPITVKGKQDPIQVYQVLRAKPRAFRMGSRGVEGVETRMVGRDTEFQQLQSAYHAMRKHYDRRVVFITGEAGIGKSRLLYEFDHWLELVPERIRYFKSRAHPAIRNLPYALLRNLFSFRFQIHDSDAPPVARHKMEEGFQETLGESEKAIRDAHLVGHLIGFDFSDSPHLQEVLQAPQQLRELALKCLADYFRTMALNYPVVILLEDMQWADDSSLEAFRYLIQTLANQPVLIACTARPEIQERLAPWCVDGVACEEVQIAQLSKHHSRLLVNEIMQKAEVIPDALRELVVGNAEGNPFYIEELIKMFIEEGVIRKSDNEEEHWYVEPARLVTAQVPATLTGLLQARLDSLAPHERKVLQCASIIGRIFWQDMVAYLGDEPPQAVTASLEALQAREMIFPRRNSAFTETQEYIFKNILLSQVTHESVLKRDRRAYHARAAEWLIAHSGERVIEYAVPIADHLQAAGKTEQARAYLNHAGQQALRLSAYSEAYTLFEKAHVLAPDGSHAQTSLAIQMGRTASYLGDYNEARRQLQACLIAARRQDDATNSAAALNYLGEIAREQGDYAEAQAWLEESLALARQAGDREREARALIDLGLFDMSAGEYSASQARFAESLELSRSLNEPHGIAFALNRLGTASMMLEEYEKATAYLQESLALCQEIGDRRGAAGALANLGETARLQKDYAQAQPFFEQALAAFREIGRRRGIIVSLTNLGHITSALGDNSGAFTYYRQALQMAWVVGLTPQMLDILAGMAQPLARMKEIPPLQGNDPAGDDPAGDAPVGDDPVGDAPEPRGATEVALELLSMVQQHPALMEESRLVIEPLLAELQAQLPPETVTAVLERGRQQKLEDVVAVLLAETL